MAENFWDLNWLGRTPEYETYKQQGGGLGYNAWVKQGKPKPPTQMSAYGESVLARAGQTPQGDTRVAPATPGEQVRIGQMGGGVTQPAAPAEQLPPNMFKTYEEALSAAPEGWEPELTEMGYWSFKRVAQKAGGAEMPGGMWKTYKEAAAAAPEGYVPVQQAGGWWSLQRDPNAPQPQEPISPYQQAQLDQQEQQFQWQQQQSQMQQAEQERQYKSQLAANPQSWLEYASYTGQTPVVQPWMLPLGYQDYGWNIGEQIGGWTPETGAEMPALRTPSAQMWNRMGPTAQAQKLGYTQSRTGARPEEQLFRLQAQRAPGGSYTSPLRWLK